ncbi:MAG: hypothetical protein FJW30_07415 [Acidobacteria bacterium]|nr:hypothetical protein [Acidobacteriota bacterium]
MQYEFSDPTEALRLARRLRDAGDLRSALDAHQWFHANALALDPSLAGVRTSFALSSWAALAEAYPPALSALRTVRDAAVEAFRAAEYRAPSLFAEVCSINRVLHELPATVQLFEETAGRNRDTADRCFPEVLAALVREKEYGLAHEFLRAPERLLERSLLTLEDNIESLPSPGELHFEALKEAYAGLYAEDLYHCLAVLEGVGQFEPAVRLRAEFLDRVDPPALRAEVARMLDMLDAGARLP